jgi:hypothetical protein
MLMAAEIRNSLFPDIDFDPREAIHTRKDCSESITRTIERHMLSFYKTPRRETTDQYRTVLNKLAKDLESKGIEFVPE